jgi:hypothetical protein
MEEHRIRLKAKRIHVREALTASAPIPDRPLSRFALLEQ